MHGGWETVRWSGVSPSVRPSLHCGTGVVVWYFVISRWNSMRSRCSLTVCDGGGPRGSGTAACGWGGRYGGTYCV